MGPGGDFDRWADEVRDSLLRATLEESSPYAKEDALVTFDAGPAIVDAAALLSLGDESEPPERLEVAVTISVEGWHPAGRGETLLPPPVRGLLPLRWIGYEPTTQEIHVGFWRDYVRCGEDLWQTPSFNIRPVDPVLPDDNTWDSMVHLYGPMVIGCWTLIGGRDDFEDVEGLYYAATMAAGGGQVDDLVIDDSALTSMRISEFEWPE